MRKSEKGNHAKHGASLRHVPRRRPRERDLMQAVRTTPLVLEALSSRLLLESELALWRHVFLGGGQSSVRSLRGRLFLVYSDAPGQGWRSSELDLFAGRFGGWHEALGDATALLAFADGAAAVRAALLLQKLGADNGIRAVLTNAECTVAMVDDAEQGRRRVLVRADGANARKALRRAPASTLLVCAQAYAALEALLADEAHGVLVTTEYNERSIPEACVTLLPQATSAMSTFAGLGSC